MNFLERIKIAAAATGIVVGLLALTDMIGNLDWGNELFSPLFIFPTLAVMFFLAPDISKYVKYK